MKKQYMKASRTYLLFIFFPEFIKKTLSVQEIHRMETLRGISLQIKNSISHYGNKIAFKYRDKSLTIRKIHFKFSIGMLYAILRVPVFKRKTEMENFEGKVNYNLLHTYLYVSYLDTVNEVNKLELSNQKNSYLKQLCFNTSFSDILCLNLICNNEELINS